MYILAKPQAPTAHITGAIRPNHSIYGVSLHRTAFIGMIISNVSPLAHMLAVIHALICILIHLGYFVPD